VFHDLLVHDLVHDLESFDGFLFRDADKLLLQGNRAETVVEEEEALRGFDAEERGDVFVVGQRSTEAYKSDIFLGCLNVPDCSEFIKDTYHLLIFLYYSE